MQIVEDELQRNAVVQRNRANMQEERREHFAERERIRDGTKYREPTD